MDSRNLLIVSENGGGFTINALDDAIKKLNIETRNIAISSNQMNDDIKYSGYVMIVDSYSNSMALNNINTICKELEKKVILFGDNNAIEEMTKIFDESIVIHVFKRPAELGEVAKTVNTLFEKEENADVMKKILVVDDNGVMLRTIMGWLEGKYEVALANSATSAFAAIERSKPDLILLDYEMPVCSGAQFMEMLALEDATKDIPIIFLTSRNDAETVREVMALKPKGYILKSSPQERILDSIKKFFGEN